MNVLLLLLAAAAQTGLVPAEKLGNVAPGLHYVYYQGVPQDARLLDHLDPVATGTVATFSTYPMRRNYDFGLRLEGYIRIDKPGTYHFFVQSDDTSELRIGGVAIMSNWDKGEQSAEVGLAAGMHTIVLRYQQGGGEFALKVSYSGPGVDKKEIPAGVLFHTKAKLAVEAGFTSLFDGDNLDDWIVVGDPLGFMVCNGEIVSESGRNGLWLRSRKQYGDFDLRLDWRVSKNGNSGVFLRCDAEANPWETGHEVQISNEPRDDMHCTGSLYGTVSVHPRPSETNDVWHHYDIRCAGKKITVTCDGVTCVDVDMDKVPAIAEKPMRGYIGLQDSHNGPPGRIEYRNIRIQELR